MRFYILPGLLFGFELQSHRLIGTTIEGAGGRKYLWLHLGPFVLRLSL